MLVSSLINEKNIENYTVLEEIVLRENHINRESKGIISQFSYTDFMNDMDILVFATPPYIYQNIWWVGAERLA